METTHTEIAMLTKNDILNILSEIGKRNVNNFIPGSQKKLLAFNIIIIITKNCNILNGTQVYITIMIILL